MDKIAKQVAALYIKKAFFRSRMEKKFHKELAHKNFKNPDTQNKVKIQTLQKGSPKAKKMYYKIYNAWREKEEKKHRNKLNKMRDQRENKQKKLFDTFAKSFAGVAKHKKFNPRMAKDLLKMKKKGKSDFSKFFNKYEGTMKEIGLSKKKINSLKKSAEKFHEFDKNFLEAGKQVENITRENRKETKKLRKVLK